MKRSFIFIGLGLSGVCLLLLTGIRTAAPPFQSRPVGRLYLLSDQSRSIAPDVLQVARLAEGIAAAVPTVPLMAPIQGSGSTSQTITASGTAFVGGGGISIYSIATTTPVDELVTVTADSPVVDVTTTKVGTSLKGEALLAAPNSIDVWGALSEAPEVRIWAGLTVQSIGGVRGAGADVTFAVNANSVHPHLRFDARGLVADVGEDQLPQLYRRLLPAPANAQDVVTSSGLDEADVSVSVPPMTVGEAGTIVLRLDKRLLLPQFGISPPRSMTKSIRVGNYASARLVADHRDFDVAEPPPAQYVWEDGPTEFYFVVTPLRAGSRNLKLLLGVRVRLLDFPEAVRERLVADRRVDVSHNPTYEAKELAPVWIPVLTVIASALTALVLWVRRRYDRFNGKGGPAGF